MNIVYVSLMLLVFMPSVLYAAEKCPTGEKRLHAEEECIPETLFNYLYCLEKSGGGKIEITRKDTTEKARNLEIRLKGAASGVVLKGEGDGGFTRAESIKAAVDINEKLDPSLASKCENILKQLRQKERKKTPAELEKENRELRTKNTELESRLSIAADKGELQKLKVETDCSKELLALKSQLDSIDRERIVDTGEHSLLDVTKLTISRDQIKGLGSSFKSFGDAAFFVNEPPMKNWKYSLITEIELLKMQMPSTEFSSVVDTHDALQEKNIHIWTSSQNIAFSVVSKTNASLSQKIVMTPSVLIQVLDTSSFGAFLSDIVTKRLDKKTENSENEKKTVTTDGTASLAELSEFFRGEVVMMMLSGLTTRLLAMPIAFSGVKASLTSAQKKGNVLYTKSNLLYQNVLVDGKETPCRVLVDQEVFIVTSPSTAFIVMITVPSFDGRSDAFAWTDNWLSGLRIPLR